MAGSHTLTLVSVLTCVSPQGADMVSHNQPHLSFQLDAITKTQVERKGEALARP